MGILIQIVNIIGYVTTLLLILKLVCNKKIKRVNQIDLIDCGLNSTNARPKSKLDFLYKILSNF